MFSKEFVDSQCTGTIEPPPACVAPIIRTAFLFDYPLFIGWSNLSAALSSKNRMTAACLSPSTELSIPLPTPRIKERFAADLHDELGANLHTIGLFSDLSKELMHSPEKLSKLLDRIRNFTERSGTAARYCTNMLEAKGICEDLVEEMNRSSDDCSPKSYHQDFCLTVAVIIDLRL